MLHGRFDHPPVPLPREASYIRCQPAIVRPQDRPAATHSSLPVRIQSAVRRFHIAGLHERPGKTRCCNTLAIGCPRRHRRVHRHERGTTHEHTHLRKQQSPVRELVAARQREPLASVQPIQQISHVMLVFCAAPYCPMTPVARFEQAILLRHFAGMEFQNKREQDVFLSYLRGFSVLFFDPTVKHIVEVGAGQSTAILALLSERSGCSVTTIDIDPQALKNKIGNPQILSRIREQINFVNGPSVSRSDLDHWYNRPFEGIGSVPATQVFHAAETFIDTTLDNRKELPVQRALNIPNLDVALVSAAIL